MIKAIIFDFDGVLVESNHIKTEAFKELFQDYPQHLDEIVKYHVLNGGLSRYIKIQYIYKKRLSNLLKCT